MTEQFATKVSWSLLVQIHYNRQSC